MEGIKLRVPVKDVHVNQPFGVNFVDFYQKLGMKGHNGIDFRARRGCPVYAAHDGIVLTAGDDGTGGNLVQIWNEEKNYKTLHYHLLDWTVNQGQIVKEGDLVGHADNTGKMTTADHDHFSLKETKEGGNTKYPKNGYNGCIDPAPYFYASYNGFLIGNKDWDKSRCYHRYYRDAKRNLAYEMKTALYMAKRLKRLPSNEEINAAIWGGWDMDAIMNPAMYEIWSQLKKDEYNSGLRPFN
ncbi:M23 family metallopeptidase [bacterium]|nr:M23 family metallopeptidase [bacterium]